MNIELNIYGRAQRGMVGDTKPHMTLGVGGLDHTKNPCGVIINWNFDLRVWRTYLKDPKCPKWLGVQCKYLIPSDD